MHAPAAGPRVSRRPSRRCSRPGPGRARVVGGAARLWGEPRGERVAARAAAERDDVRRPGGTYAVPEGLHPGGLERHARAGPAVAPAGPRGHGIRLAIWPGLAVELEDDRVVALEAVRDLRPEGGRVIEVGHRLLMGRLGRPRRAPLQVEDRVEPVLVEQVHVVLDRLLVARAGIAWVGAVDREPAVLVQRKAYGVALPVLDRQHRREIDRALEDGPALDTGGLGPGAVHSVKHQRARRIHELIPLGAQR